MSVIRNEEPSGCDRLIHIWSCRNIIHLNRRDTVIHIRCKRTSELFQTVAKSYIPTFNLHYPVFFFYPRTGQKGRLSETVKHWLNLLKWKEEIMPEYWHRTHNHSQLSATNIRSLSSVSSLWLSQSILLSWCSPSFHYNANIDHREKGKQKSK